MTSAAPGPGGFRFDAEDSEDELEADDTGGLDDMLLVDQIRVDWGGEREMLEDLLDASGMSAALGFGLEGDPAGGLLEDVIPAADVDGTGAEQTWKASAESALVAKTSRDTLSLLAVGSEAEHAPGLRDKLLKRAADAGARFSHVKCWRKHTFQNAAPRCCQQAPGCSSLAYLLLFSLSTHLTCGPRLCYLHQRACSLQQSGGWVCMRWVCSYCRLHALLKSHGRSCASCAGTHGHTHTYLQ